ncbi:fimbrial biogenesis chaperone [Pedobacter hartonius]|nr:hypothetical protein [Pedobacter hartonius]
MPENAKAQGNLLILPKRIVFDGSRRTQDLNLANTGKDTATYIISMIQIRMKEDGTFENITQPDSGQYFADKSLRIFPRSVTLAPRESQTVKIQVIQAANLGPGEYRSHIYFRAVPRTTAAGEKPVVTDSANLSVKLVPVFGISIPAIIRVGENSSGTAISDVSVDLVNVQKPQLNMCLNRIGNMSVYGDLYVNYISLTGKKIRVGAVNGIAVYTPLPRRKVTMKLDILPGVDYHSGKLEIQYALPTAAKIVMLSEKELPLQ